MRECRAACGRRGRRTASAIVFNLVLRGTRRALYRAGVPRGGRASRPRPGSVSQWVSNTSFGFCVPMSGKPQRPSSRMTEASSRPRLGDATLIDAFTVFAIDMPGMGWSDITPGASYTEPALRGAIVEFVKALDLDDVKLAGESMARPCHSRRQQDRQAASDASSRSTPTTTPKASLEPTASPRSTSAVHACPQSVVAMIARRAFPSDQIPVCLGVVPSRPAGGRYSPGVRGRIRQLSTRRVGGSRSGTSRPRCALSERGRGSGSSPSGTRRRGRSSSRCGRWCPLRARTR